MVKATYRTGMMGERARALAIRGGFTLIDLVVSMAIIAVLISLLLPALSSVRETTRRVVCMSNQRQHGLGLAMYADDHNGQLPASAYVPKSAPPNPQMTNIVRRDDVLIDTWDGLGLLYSSDYINAPQVFYCPSHHGQYPMSSELPIWAASFGKIVMNYQYRGDALPAGASPATALLCDGLATRSDFSHNVGSNVLRADYGVSWIPDLAGRIAADLPFDSNDAQAALKVSRVWLRLDTGN